MSGWKSRCQKIWGGAQIFIPQKKFDNSVKLAKLLVFRNVREFSIKSFIAKKEQTEHKWQLVDADGLILGRMAAKIAPILMGKTKPIYTPHVDTGDYVIVVNADKIRVRSEEHTSELQSH